MKPDRGPLACAVSLLVAVGCAGSVEDRPPEHEVDSDERGTIERLNLSPEAYVAGGIDVAEVTPRVLTPTVRVTGTLSYDEGRLGIASARVGGRIARVVADLGQLVEPGEPLAWIDSPELGAAQAEYRRTLGMSRLRRAEYDRAVLLLAGRAISRGEMLRREADWRAAQADLEAAEQRLHILGLSQSDLEALSGDGDETGHVYPVRAPVGGRVTEREAVTGRVVASADELFTVADIRSLWLFLQVFEKDLPSIAEGAAVTLTCESHSDDRFLGTVDFVGQVLDPHSRTVSARAVIDNPAGELRPGMFVYATIEARAAEPPPAPALAIPAAAVAELDDESVVFVRDAGRSFEVRAVVLGRTAGDWVEVRSGLSAGESIAVAGVFTLKSEVRKGGLEGHDH